MYDARALENVVIEGGCLCGAVRFSAPDPTEGAYCHCRRCQRSAGGPFMTMVKVARRGFEFTKGKPRYFRSSPLVQRGFCENCGSPLTFAYDKVAELWLLLGALDNPAQWPLTHDATWGTVRHYHVDSKVSWTAIDDGLPQNTGEATPFRNAARRAAAMGGD